MASKDATNETNCNAQQESPAILFVKFDNNSELQKKKFVQFVQFVVERKNDN